MLSTYLIDVVLLRHNVYSFYRSTRLRNHILRGELH
jgi:hypothetical protein